MCILFRLFMLFKVAVCYFGSNVLNVRQITVHIKTLITGPLSPTNFTPTVVCIKVAFKPVVAHL